MNEKMIQKYNIRLGVNKDKLVVDSKIGRSAKDKQYIKEHRDELLEILIDREEKKEQELQEKRKRIESIQGLKELQKTIADWNRYSSAMSRYIERDCTGNAPEKPKKTIAEVKQEYSKAAAYVKADQWSYSSHYFKSSCGERAKEAILNGEDFETAIDDMVTAWKKYTEESVD